MVSNIFNQPSHWARRTRRKYSFLFSKKQSLAATRVARSDRKWPQVTPSHLFYSTKPVKSVICGHLQSLGWPQEIASDRWSKWPHALIPKNVLHFSRLLTENVPRFPDRNEWRMLKGKGVAWHKGGETKEILHPSHTKRGDSKQNREVGTKRGDLKQKRWKRQDLNWWGKDLKQTRRLQNERMCGKRQKKELTLKRQGAIWNETQRSWNEEMCPQAEEAGPKLETYRRGLQNQRTCENERERSLL